MKICSSSCSVVLLGVGVRSNSTLGLLEEPQRHLREPGVRNNVRQECHGAPKVCDMLDLKVPEPDGICTLLSHLFRIVVLESSDVEEIGAATCILGPPLWVKVSVAGSEI